MFGIATHHCHKPLEVFKEDLVLWLRLDLLVVFSSARDAIEVSLDIRGELGVDGRIVIRRPCILRVTMSVNERVPQ